MDCVQACGEAISTTRERWAFSYRVDGDLRFTSHHDTLRLFARAFARAGLPVTYSAGFNPHPRLSIPLPRPVGVASDAEVLVVDFDVAVESQAVLRELNHQMPVGIEVTGARPLGVGERLRPVLARYRLELGEVAVDEVERCVRGLLERAVLEVERLDGKRGEKRSIDARPFIAGMQVAGRALEFSLRISQQGTVRPAEIAGLLGYDVRSINHRIHRLEVQWQ